MPDWSAEPLAREIEHRRSKGRRLGTARTRSTLSGEDQISDWSDADWAAAFERRHGLKADPRFGKTRVREVNSDGAVLFDGDVHVFHLTGQAHPWQGFAWRTEQQGKSCFVSMVGVAGIRSAREAVKAWLASAGRRRAT